MPLSKINLHPGINTQATPTLNEGGWSGSNLVRWWDTFLEKVGGWTQLFSTTVAGLARGMHAYQGLSNDNYLLIGSSAAIQVYYSGTLYTLQCANVKNITTGWLTSTASSSTYTVTDVAHGLTTGQQIKIVIPASVGGITLFPQTVTITKLTADTYTFVGNKVATSNETRGDSPLFQVSGPLAIDAFVSMTNNGLTYGDTFTVQVGVTVGGITFTPGDYVVVSLSGTDIGITTSDGQVATGYGLVWENANQFGQSQGQLAYPATVTGVNNWFLDNFGNIALLCFGGPIYTWTPPPSAGTFAPGLASPAPQLNNGMFVAMPQAQIITMGAEAAGIQDSLLLRWCDAGDYTSWVADATNQAGSFRLSRGSKIVGGLQAPQFTAIWTDIDLWSMQYIGPPFIYSFNVMASGCGLIAPRAATIIHNITFWMSQKQFFMMGAGGVEQLPCTVWDIVFKDLDSTNVSKCFAGSNSAYNEVWFFYPSASGATGECDSYVKYNITSKLWDYGKMPRTAWIDQTVFGPPISTDTSLVVQQQEVGYDANGTAISGAYALSGYIDLEDGDNMIFIDQLIPDFKWSGTGG